MILISNILQAIWDILKDASIYMLFGMLAGGLLKVFLSAEYVSHHLGRGRFLPVIKAALFGIPLPLCSCGVLPAAAALKRQGASNGATIAFLVSTPESGVDSISLTYALMDPLMTLARPIAALISALAAGFTEEMSKPPESTIIPVKTPCSGACSCRDSGTTIEPSPTAPVSLMTRLTEVLHYAFIELWGEIAAWFTFGLLLSAIITVLVPETLLSTYLGGNFGSMILMLAFGIPIYICASASTPIAAALILKGVSPGAALVFLLVGPATNMASLSVLTNLLGKRAVLRYLLVISIIAVGAGLLLNQLYTLSGISPRALTGQAAELIPSSLKIAGAIILMLLSAAPLYRVGRRIRVKLSHNEPTSGCHCGCPTER
ncbi:MAG: SO_0444 family Cu/Zn efflux transporter [Proteobacteria bacterium]|nr:SO_0444 family Cu/Zn efflux transporter [Pseudomonadota bacterium]MBU1686840.1 SO_0444 family Cu/Zn efflux transporter [Pseudomonadota bacterium]